MPAFGIGVNKPIDALKGLQQRRTTNKPLNRITDFFVHGGHRSVDLAHWLAYFCADIPIARRANAAGDQSLFVVGLHNA